MHNIMHDMGFMHESRSSYEVLFSDPAPPRYYVLSLISAILRGANTSIDTTDKDRSREGGKQLSPDKIYLDDHLELGNRTVSSCICEVL